MLFYQNPKRCTYTAIKVLRYLNNIYRYIIIYYIATFNIMLTFILSY